MREAGVLMPVASLPSRFGIGDFGETSYQFVDRLVEAGIRVWQILPLNPLGFGNSPYQPYSSYAGDDLYISIDKLKEEGLLKKSQIKHPRTKRYSINYDVVRKAKETMLQAAYKNFKPDEEYEQFCKQDWVYHFAVFMALKKQNGLRCWNEWPKEQKDWIEDKMYDISHLSDEISYTMFKQYEFQKQWTELKQYANERNVKIMGDLPFYVGIDSLDVWENKQAFLLDEEGKPRFIAGVPPDFFSETGQRWGNPIYDWDYIKANGFKFWLDRIRYVNSTFDIIRIDHFRAFDTYWKVKASCDTAIDGEWIEAPGYEFFDTLFKDQPDVHIVVEDLGDLRREVEELRDHYGFMGMDVLQFTIFGQKDPKTAYKKENILAYTGTHDNQPIRGWYHMLETKEKRTVRRRLKALGINDNPVSFAFCRLACQSGANLAVLAYQDIINLSDKGRINTPATLGSPNWEWRIHDYSDWDKHAQKLKELIEETNRG